MNDAELKLRELNQGGVRGIVKILVKKGTLKKSPLIASVVVGMSIIVIVSLTDKNNLYKLLTDTVDLLLSFFPNLLGFSLGGYSLIVGFGNLDLIKKGSKIDTHSVYQILNAIFSLSIILQIFTTISCFVISWALKSELLGLWSMPVDWPAHVVNGMLLWLLSFAALYSLALTPYVVSNLFTLSQVNHLYLTIENLKEKQKELEKQKHIKNTENNTP